MEHNHQSIQRDKAVDITEQILTRIKELRSVEKDLVSLTKRKAEVAHEG